MDQKNDEFRRKLQATFTAEAGEHVQAIFSGLIQLEKISEPGKQGETVETIFREAHSLKGAARAVNWAEIETVCQSLENVFAALQHRKIALSPELFDLLHKATDTLDILLRGPALNRTEAPDSAVQPLLERLEAALRASRPPVPQDQTKRAANESVLAPQLRTGGADQSPATEKPALVQTVRISTAKLHSLLLQAEELLGAKLAAGEQAADLRDLSTTLAESRKQWARLRSDVRAVHRRVATPSKGNAQAGLQSEEENTNSPLAKVLGFLQGNETHFQSLERRLAELVEAAEQQQRTLSSQVDAHLADMKKAFMLPFSSLSQGFPKLVRDLARDRGKEVDLVIQGEEIEIDRRILEQMNDPLIHLVRNSIDHGIEKPAERARKRKPSRGTVTLAVTQKDGGRAEITVSDDGAGIDLAKVRAAAVKLEHLPPEAAEMFDDSGALALIFHSGISTSPIVTDLSGRGLGLAIVREKVERLDGTIAVETQPGAGTAFRIILPLTLATFRGILVRACDRLFVLPTTKVARVARVNKREIRTVENRETVLVDGQAASLVPLGDTLELPRKEASAEPGEEVTVLVLSVEEKRIAFLVDEVVGEQEVLVKKFGPQLARVRNVAGAAVLGTGEVVPILNVPDLIQSAVRASAPPAPPRLAGAKEAPAKQRAVLVAEDSITARTLLKNILETAGYKVKTAVDGVEALAALRTEDFHLLVSDVDMPRMSGFELTAKVRADKKLSELPVVLVTALESREDRERGIDVGASAYIVKSSFDQSNLLEVLRRLI